MKLRAFLRRCISIFRDRSGGTNFDVVAQNLKTVGGKVSAYREVSIGKMLYRLTSLFEGSKDIDKTMERLAIQNAMSQPEQRKKA
ncbi:hypothetical protein HNQ56_003482 [Anaerotaenia torta]|uniref:hypothetical protein n=1 Tax=Anaerotaenia torta TaxID=433293 RepID=UPI003D1EF041